MALLPSSPDQQKKLLIALVPLLLAFAYYQFVHTKKVVEIDTLQEQLSTMETMNAAAKIIAERGGPELEQRLALLEQNVERLEELIPRREEVPDLLFSLGQRAQAVGVELTRMAPGPEEVGPYYTKTVYEISVKGRYHDVGRFLAEVGSLPRIITPTQIQVRNTTGETHDDGSPLLAVGFQIVTYIVPDPVIPADTVVSNAES